MTTKLLTITKLLSSNLGEFMKLTGLYLSWNNLNSIPKELSNLTNLTQLYLYQNKLN